jgi:hypothetical protein
VDTSIANFTQNSHFWVTGNLASTTSGSSDIEFAYFCNGADNTPTPSASTYSPAYIAIDTSNTASGSGNSSVQITGLWYRLLTSTTNAGADGGPDAGYNGNFAMLAIADMSGAGAVLAAISQIVASIDQLVLPVSDTSNTGVWTQMDGVTTTNLWMQINEAVANDSNFDESPQQPLNSQYVARLGTVQQPISGTITLHTRAFKDVSKGQVDYVVSLMQGATVIQSFTHTNISTTPTQFDDVVTNTITNWSTPFDVRFQMNESA